MQLNEITPIVQGVEGSTAILRCNAKGVPPPVISWSRANGNAMEGGQQTLYVRINLTYSVQKFLF